MAARREALAIAHQLDGIRRQRSTLETLALVEAIEELTAAVRYVEDSERKRFKSAADLLMSEPYRYNFREEGVPCMSCGTPYGLPHGTECSYNQEGVE